LPHRNAFDGRRCPSAFSKYGGNLGTDGSVAFLFRHCGQLVFAPGTDENKLMGVALDSGADDVVNHDDGSIEVITPNDFVAVKEALARRSSNPSLPRSDEADHGNRFQRRQAARMQKLLDALEAMTTFRMSTTAIMENMSARRYTRRDPVDQRRILGIDPGLRVTGFGVMSLAAAAQVCGQRLHLLYPGRVQAAGAHPARPGEHCRRHQPGEVAVQRVFVNVSPASACSSAQARAAADPAAVLAHLPVSDTRLAGQAGGRGPWQGREAAGAGDGDAAARAAFGAFRRRRRRARLRHRRARGARGMGGRAGYRVAAGEIL
jgi:hypothetical protein